MGLSKESMSFTQSADMSAFLETVAEFKSSVIVFALNQVDGQTPLRLPSNLIMWSKVAVSLSLLKLVQQWLNVLSQVRCDMFYIFCPHWKPNTVSSDKATQLNLLQKHWPRVWINKNSECFWCSTKNLKNDVWCWLEPAKTFVLMSSFKQSCLFTGKVSLFLCSAMLYHTTAY